MSKYDKEVLEPDHYNQGGVETLDVIRGAVGREGFQAYCLGNAIKYCSRALYKGKPRQDVEKAIFYLRCFIGDDPRQDRLDPRFKRPTEPGAGDTTEARDSRHGYLGSSTTSSGYKDR